MQNNRLIELVRAYAEHFAQYSRTDYNETEVRNDFINPFFEILGWDVLNKKKLPQHLREVKHEASVYVEEDGENRKKKPDYAFHLGTEVCFFLETKKPSVNIMENKEAAFQTRRYGWNGNLKASILSNFTDMIIYDTSIRPSENDEVSKAMIAHYDYTEYVDKFTEISRLLSYASVVSGEFFEIFDKVTDTFRKEPFDKYFLTQIKEWRYSLSQNIYDNNCDLDEESLNVFVQRIINRIVFLRICEDRNLEQYETLKKIKTYTELRALFNAADKKYNSGLFELIDEENIQITDALLIHIFQELYYPNSCYEFSIVDPYIIGQIYELFLEEKIAISDIKVVAEKKAEIIDSQGVVNTPKNITDIIVGQTLEPLYKYELFSKWNTYRIADICCGSGNFLLSAYEYILNCYTMYYIEMDKDNALQRGILISKGEGSYTLSFDKKYQILKQNIYGVDIDNLATEVAKFSLLIKLIEDVSLDEIKNYAVSTHGKVLPNLDNNIRNGNSLVDSKYLIYNSHFYEDIELISQIKLFDWNTEFKGRKFDAIIGNPPYIRVQNMVHYSESEYKYLKSDISEFETAKSELLDKYYLFLERGLELLGSDGRLGYIVPHKFMLIKAGTVLRKMLSEKKCVEKIIHFGTGQVFKGKSTYTCLLFLEKTNHKKFKIGFVKNLNEYYAANQVELREYPIEYLSVAPWSFLSEDIVSLLDQVKDKCQQLEEISDIFVGLQTSADMIYIIKAQKEENGLTYFIDCRGKEQCVETDILKPCIYDIQLEKYVDIEPNMMLIFPYHTVKGKPILYSIDEMRTVFPKTLAYLEEYKEDLEQRSIQRRTENNWYQFGRSQSIKRFSEGEHLIWSVLSTEGNYVYDDKTTCFTGGGNGPFYGLEKKISTKESLYYIQALLNYWLLERVVKSKASTFRGDYYSHGKQFIAKLPIYRIDFENIEEAKKHDEIVSSVKNIMELKRRRNTQKTKEQKNTYCRLIEAESQHLDGLISELYGTVKEYDNEK